MSSKPAPVKYSKIIRFNEYMWLFFAVLAIILTVYSLITGDREQAIYFLALTFLSGLFYSFKKRMRKRYQAREEEQK